MCSAPGCGARNGVSRRPLRLRRRRRLVTETWSPPVRRMGHLDRTGSWGAAAAAVRSGCLSVRGAEALCTAGSRMAYARRRAPTMITALTAMLAALPGRHADPIPWPLLLEETAEYLGACLSHPNQCEPLSSPSRIPLVGWQDSASHPLPCPPYAVTRPRTPPCVSPGRTRLHLRCISALRGPRRRRDLSPLRLLSRRLQRFRRPGFRGLSPAVADGLESGLRH